MVMGTRPFEYWIQQGSSRHRQQCLTPSMGEPLYGEPISFNVAEEDPSFNKCLCRLVWSPLEAMTTPSFHWNGGTTTTGVRLIIRQGKMSPLLTLHLQVPQKIGKTWPSEPQGGWLEAFH